MLIHSAPRGVYQAMYSLVSAMRILKYTILVGVLVGSFPLEGLAQQSVSEHLTMGNPSEAKDSDGDLNNRLVIKDQFVLSFDNKTANANWVSWRVAKEWLGNEERANNFRVDDDLPDLLTHVKPSVYAKTGFDQGHVCPSGDRTRNKTVNSATFVMSNMIPQAPRNNRQTWRMLEMFEQSEARKKNEVYVIAGPFGSGGTGSKGFQTRLGDEVTVPSVTWKVVMILPNQDGDDVARVTKDTRAFGVIMPNRQDIKTDWQRYKVSVRQVEELTGLNFFNLVDQKIQDEIEKRR